MTPRILLIAFLVPLAALAAGKDQGKNQGPVQQPGSPFDGLTVSMTYPSVLVTHYSATPRGGAPCRYECYTRGGRRHCVGGPDKSPVGLRPSEHRLDRPGQYYGRPTVLAAVPQRRGTAGLLGCFFSLPDAHPGVLFFGGDTYGAGSNGKIKTDVSSACSPIVNLTQHSRLVAYNCPGRKGGVAPPVKRDIASVAPKKDPVPLPKSRPSPADEIRKDSVQGDSCQWYAVLLCNQSQSESVSDARRLGLSGLPIVHTDDFSNMQSGWYCVADPASSQAEASSKVSQYRGRAPSSYTKKGCH